MTEDEFRDEHDCRYCGRDDRNHPDHNKYDCAYCCAEKWGGEE